MMRQVKLSRYLTAILLGLLMQTAAAFDLRFLNYSPVRYFSKQDWELASAAVRKALNEAKDGETVGWDNPQTKCSGSITPIATDSEDGAACRRIKIENNAKGMSGSTTYRFCQSPDGTWAVQQGASATSTRP
jgi:surface antigen